MMPPETSLPYAQAPKRPFATRADIARVIWRIVGFLTFLGVLGAAIMMKSPLTAVIDPASILLVVAGTTALLMAVYGWSGFANAHDTLTRGSSLHGTPTEAVGFFRFGAVAGLACGFLGTVIGLVIMLQNMSDAASLGPAMAVALLTDLYGALLAILLYCAAMIIARREPALDTTTPESRGAVPVAAAAMGLGTSGILITFFALLIAMQVL